jgi:hypothetical protein
MGAVVVVIWIRNEDINHFEFNIINKYKSFLNISPNFIEGYSTKNKEELFYISVNGELMSLSFDDMKTIRDNFNKIINYVENKGENDGNN